MPLTGPQTVSVYRAIAAVRPDWDDAGVHKFVSDLAVDTRPAFELLLQAATAAANTANRTPERILDPIPAAPAEVREIRPPLPVEQYVDCPVCGVPGDPTVPCLPCKQNAAEKAAAQRQPRPVAEPFRRSCPPPADFRERVARAAAVARQVEEARR